MKIDHHIKVVILTLIENIKSRLVIVMMIYFFKLKKMLIEKKSF